MHTYGNTRNADKLGNLTRKMWNIFAQPMSIQFPREKSIGYVYKCFKDTSETMKSLQVKLDDISNGYS